MFKKILTIFIVIFFSFNNIFWFGYIVFASELECGTYKTKYNKCSLLQEGETRSEEDFICIGWPTTDILLQIILDEKFSEIDTRIEDDMAALREGKEYSDEKLDEVVKKYSKQWDYWQEYEKLCKWGIIKEYYTCFSKITLPSSWHFLWWNNNGSDCMKLVDIKLAAYRHTLFWILKLNKLDVRKEARKKYVEWERTKYTTVISILWAILGFINLIWKEWQTKTRKPYSCW